MPERPGLGIEPDMDQINAAHELYKKVAGGARDEGDPAHEGAADAEDVQVHSSYEL